MLGADLNTQLKLLDAIAEGKLQIPKQLPVQRDRGEFIVY